MSADIINLPRKEQPPSRLGIREAVRIGPTQHISIIAVTAAEIGTPLVELRCPSGEIIHLTPNHAIGIAGALKRAAIKARL